MLGDSPVLFGPAFLFALRLYACIAKCLHCEMLAMRSNTLFEN
jgi:hypothetical protein